MARAISTADKAFSQPQLTRGIAEGKIHIGHFSLSRNQAKFYPNRSSASFQITFRSSDESKFLVLNDQLPSFTFVQIALAAIDTELTPIELEAFDDRSDLAEQLEQKISPWISVETPEDEIS